MGAGATLASAAFAKRALADTAQRKGWNRRTLRRLHEVMEGYVARGELPGLALALSRGGRPHTDAIGTLELGGSERTQRDTIFRIASITKPITAVATLMLVEDGKLTLDEPVDRLLPELAQRRVLTRPDGPITDTVPANRAITPRDLLTFTWGFGLKPELLSGPAPIMQAALDLEITASGPPEPAIAPPPDEWMRRLGTLPLMHQPGETWLYNTGSDVLGVLVARAAGCPFDEFMQERIFEPLRMHDTFFSVPPDKLHRMGASYVVDPQTGALQLFDRAEGGQWSSPPAFPSGAGGLCSTLDDYLAFSQMLLNLGEHRGQRLLRRESVAAMTTDQLTPNQKARASLTPGYFDTHGWGYGVAIATSDADPSEPRGAYGWIGGTGTAWLAIPSQGMTTIILTQRALTSADPPPIFRDFWALAQQS